VLKPEEISGSKCPFCGGKDAYWGEVTIEDDTAQQRATCATKAGWQSTISLESHSTLKNTRHRMI